MEAFGTIKLRHFRQQQQGAVAILVGVTLFLMLIATGIGIDVGRIFVVRNKLHRAMDASGLAAVSSLLSQPDVPGAFVNHMAANFPDGYMGVNLGAPVINNAFLPDGRQVFDITMSAEVPMTFMRLLGNDTVTVNLASQITRTLVEPGSSRELVILLDNSYSTTDPPIPGDPFSRLEGIRFATGIFLTNLFAPGPMIPEFFVSLVPFDSAVKMEGRPDWIQPAFVGEYNTPGTGGRIANHDIDDGDPVDNPFELTEANPDGTKEPERLFRTPYPGDPDPMDPLNTGDGSSPDLAPVIFQEENRDTLLASLGNLQLAGFSRLNVAMSWGWYLLSPAWQGGYWRADRPDLPLMYGRPKAIVLISASPTESRYPAEDNARFTFLCNEVRSRGILLYVVAYGANADQALLQGCVNPPVFLFPAATTAELVTQLSRIADTLHSVRISQ